MSNGFYKNGVSIKKTPAEQQKIVTNQQITNAVNSYRDAVNQNNRFGMGFKTQFEQGFRNQVTEQLRSSYSQDEKGK